MAWSVDDIPDQSERVIFITGVTSGIGYECAKVLAQRGAHLVVACRNKEKMGAVADELRAAGAKAVHELVCDIGDLDSVRACAEQYAGPPLDVLLLNAGTSLNHFTTTKQGYETVFATNHLGHFLLCGLLLPKVTGRIIVVSSIGHRSCTDVDWAVVRGDESKYVSGPASYGQSKLASMLFVEELNRRLVRTGSDVVAVATHPGMSNTPIMSKMPKLGLVGYVFKAAMALSQSAADGALPLLMAATDADVQRGNYYAPSRGLLVSETWGPPIPNGAKNPALADEELAKAVWEESEKLTEFRFEV